MTIPLPRKGPLKPYSIYVTFRKKRIDLLSKAIEKLAGKGLRVLGVAKSTISQDIFPETQHDFNFEFVGLIGLSDPVREHVDVAVSECYKAGIRVIMITGDYPVTAKNIAREIGLKNYEACITGQELNEMSEEELCEKIRHINIFARVIPEQKLKIVNALKKNQEDGCHDR